MGSAPEGHIPVVLPGKLEIQVDIDMVVDAVLNENMAEMQVLTLEEVCASAFPTLAGPGVAPLLLCWLGPGVEPPLWVV